jgi:cytochrome c oxidase subunit IV
MSEPKHDAAHAEEHQKHASPGLYFAVFGALTVITVIEVIAAYIPVIRVPVLLLLSFAKAYLVVAFFMHLRYEKRILTWVFLLPLIFGAVMIVLTAPLSR